MRICADCFKADEWKNKFSLQEKRDDIPCDVCGMLTTTIDFNNFKPYFLKILSVFKNYRYGVSLPKLINVDFDIFSNDAIAKKALKAFGNDIGTNLNLNANCTYKDDVLVAKKRWDDIKKKVIGEFRFFTSIDPVEEGWEEFFKQDRYMLIKRGTVFYRGRINDNAKKPLKKLSDMGMPPAEKARAGRVNPHGIPCLYLTELPETTIYELRATYGDKVSIGTFKVEKDLKIIDFTYRPMLTNSIDNDNLNEDVNEFLLKRQIGTDLSKPMRRYDNKEIEYVPTQYICEFIKSLGADGIKYNSAVHHDGKNLVLFNDDKVRCINVEVKTVDEPEMRFCS